jgi:hypothetical protein
MVGGRRETARVAAFSLVAVWLFFAEYLPPVVRVHLWSDIEGFHWPLLNAIHKALRDGRLPLWDSSIYCGIPLAGNLQAGLFYPPNWILFLLQAGSDSVSFLSLELLVFAHVWLLFVLGFLWLRPRASRWLPAVCGAAVPAFGGYILSQMNHLGLACAVTWFPLAFLGVDQMSARGSWRPASKVSLASALCFLAGYPPTWVCFCISVAAYSLASRGTWRTALRASAAIAFSLLLAAPALLPAMEASERKVHDLGLGASLPDGPGMLVSYFLPNYFDQNRTVAYAEATEGAYLYLGSAALFACAYLILRPRQARVVAAGFAALLASMAIMVTPEPWLNPLLSLHPALGDVVRRFNFLAAPVFAVALFTSTAVDAYAGQPAASRPGSTGLRPLWMAAASLWSVWLLLFVWPRSGFDAPAGLASGLFAAACLAFLASGLLLYRNQPSPALAAVLLFMLFAEYKTFGSNRRFNAVNGDLDAEFAVHNDARIGGAGLTGTDGAIYSRMLSLPHYRIALFEAPHPTDMRHYRLATPQGFDPFLSRQYRQVVERFVPFASNRLFYFNTADRTALDFFAVRFVIAIKESGHAEKLRADPSFRLLEPSNSFFQVFEREDAQPPWRFDGPVQLRKWTPESRVFRIQAAGEGPFLLKEQYFPGWRATIDGLPASIATAEGAFQQVSVPPGSHDLEFEYRPASVAWGLAISAAGIAGLVVFSRRKP